MILKTRSGVLQAASLFAAKNDVRYYLNGIYIERESDSAFYVVGINGHVAFMSRQVTSQVIPESFKSVILSGSTLPVLKKPADVSLLSVADGWAMLEVQYDAKRSSKRRYVVECIDGKFPQWREPLRNALKGERKPATLDTNYMDLCTRAEQALGNRKAQPHFSMCGEEAPTLVTFKDQASLAVVMPMRAMSTPSVPAWASALAAEQKAEVSA